MAAFGYAGTYADCDASYSGTSATVVWIKADNCDATSLYVHPGYYAKDRTWFAHRREALAHDNIVYERTLWRRRYVYPEPKQSARQRQIEGFRNAQSYLQRKREKRKVRIQSI